MRPPAAVLALAALALVSLVATGVVVLFGGMVSVEATLAAIGHWVEADPATALALFAAWALLANFIIVPSGSLTVVVAGFFIGAWIPALIWWGAQVLTAPILHAIGRRCIDPALVERWLATALPRSSIETLRIAAKREALMSSVLLRLTPMLPGAPSAIIAASVGIPRSMFVLATIAVGWIRPLYFASFGAALPALQNPSDLMTLKVLLPLAALFGLSASALGIRVWLDRRQRRFGRRDG